MVTIATLGPVGSDNYLAAKEYCRNCELHLFSRLEEALHSFTTGESELLIIPVYNTRQGEVKDSLKLMAQLEDASWIDNVVLPIHLSFGALDATSDELSGISTIIGRSSVFNQAREFIDRNYPDATHMAVHDVESSIVELKETKEKGYGVIDSEEIIKQHDLSLVAREVVSHNRTRFAVISRAKSKVTGYDATALITRPLRDRVGMLADILNEFTRRGINILDLRSENDIKTQKLQIYLEVEGHVDSQNLLDAIKTLEFAIIQEKNGLKVLGSFPRIDMRVKQIKNLGFVGSGDMSVWFSERLENEGYSTTITGRSTTVTPKEMVSQVDVVLICVPISVTSSTIAEIGPLLHDGQALIILAGESEDTIRTALEKTSQGVEVMFVHNLWGPQVLTMKEKNAIVVKTPRSGSFCSEFESFLYKHGADIYHDSAQEHDLLMGVSQKLPTTLSVALAMTLKDHRIDSKNIASHSTLTSLYGILAMARIHNQNPRTYAEIMATSGEGQQIVRSFVKNIGQIIDLAEKGEIEKLVSIMEDNTQNLTQPFLQSRMEMAQAVDEIMSDPSMKYF